MNDDHYAKLDQRIVYSSMWEEDGDTCKVWVTLLALKNLQTGIVDKNITGIARLCNLPLAKVEEAFRKFMSPDPNSSSPDHEGRRLLQVPGGYFVVNHQKYTELGWSEEKREYERRRKAEQRARKNGNSGRETPPPDPPKKPSAAPSAIPESLSSSQKFMELWTIWNEHLVEKKKRPTLNATRMQIEKLAGMGVERAIAALKNSITNNYQGIFESNEHQNKPTSKPLQHSQPNNGF